MKLQGVVALVTGGSGTIGLAISKALVKEGAASVILCGRRPEALQEAVKAIQQSTKTTSTFVSAIPCDVTEEDSVARMFVTIQRELGRSVDLLINNAGINIPGEALSASDFEKVLQVNVLGPYICSREAIRSMKAKGGGGRIINIGSLSAISPRPDSAAYTTSKFALEGLTQSLALDARAHQIAVGIIHPGNVMSEMLTPEMVDSRNSEGFLPAEQIADCVIAMSSLPYSTNVLEITVLPTSQPFVGRG